MTRPPSSPARDEIPEDERDAFDMVVDRNEAKFGGKLPPYHAALLNSPPFGAALNQLGRLARTAGERPGTYSHAEREFVDQVLSADWGTNVVQSLHVPDALAVGVRLEAIEALRSGHEEDLTPDERQLAEYIRAVVNGTMTDEAYEAMERRLGQRGAVEYTIFIGFLNMTIRLFQAFGMPDPDDEQIEALLRDLRTGARELPDPSVRFD
jgi:alkylhydroperoxidase family enzyme